MRQETAERRIKALQKQFLVSVEEHPIFHQLDTEAFNDLRKRVFRGTFEAYRLGVVGLGNERASLFNHFFGWLDRDAAALSSDVRREVGEMCFRAALESYRIGAMVAAEKSMDPAMAQYR